jgi:DNA-binding HxlR family transcriptional regulator
LTGARTDQDGSTGRELVPAFLSDGHCQAETLKLLGDYTTLRIIDFLRTGGLRFTELQRGLGDTNSVTLTKRLKHLEAAGILNRHEATFDRQSVSYSLSETGLGLLPVLTEIQNFTRRLHSSLPSHRSGNRN